MATLIEQLQQEALDPKVAITDLLRKTKLVAAKLGIGDAVEWVEHEMEGYPADTRPPAYRDVVGQPRYWNRVHGWSEMRLPPEIQEIISVHHLEAPVSEIEALLGGGGDLRIPFSPGQVAALEAAFGQTLLQPSLFFGRNIVARILDAVRNRVVNWALQLEAAGVKGEGTVSFSKQDKEAAATTTYNISIGGSVTGAVGSVEPSATVNASSHAEAAGKETIKRLAEQLLQCAPSMTLAKDQRESLQRDAVALQKEIAQMKPSPGKLKGLLSSIRSIAEIAAGDIVGAGVLQLLARPEIAALLTRLH